MFVIKNKENEFFSGIFVAGAVRVNWSSFVDGHSLVHLFETKKVAKHTLKDILKIDSDSNARIESI